MADGTRVALDPAFPLLWDDSRPLVSVATRPANGGAWAEWSVVPEFFQSTSQDRHVRIEVDNDACATVIFPDGVNGRTPDPGDALRVRWVGGRPVAQNTRAGQIRHHARDSGDVVPPGLPRAVDHDDLISLSNPLAVQGSRAPESAGSLRRRSRAMHAGTPAPAKEEDYRVLALKQPGVVEAHVEVRGPLFVLTLRMAAGSEAAFAAAQAALVAARQAGTFVWVREALPRDVRLTVLVRVDDEGARARTARDVRAALTQHMQGRTGHALGQPLTPQELERAVAGIARSTQVVDLDYAQAAATKSRARVLTVAANRYLRLSTAVLNPPPLRLLMVRPFGMRLATSVTLSDDLRRRVFRTLSGTSSTLMRAGVISVDTVQLALERAELFLDVVELDRGGIPFRILRLEDDEVPYLASIVVGW